MDRGFPINATRVRALACLVVFGVIWFWGLGHRPLFTTDEGRYAEIPREMLVTGNWVTPRLDGLRYFEKPPLQYWATASAYAVFGVHDWTARLWAALCGFLTVLLTGFAAARLYGTRAGWLAGAMLAGSFYFGFLGHFNTLDAGLAFAMSLTLFGFLLGQHAAAGTRSELGWMLVAYAGAALAVLTKGLIGILLPGAVLVLYLLLKRDLSRLRRLRLGWGVLLFLALTLPWFVAVSLQNPDFLWQFFMVQEFLRFLTPISHRPGAWWYFLPLLFLAVLPWLASTARGLVRPLRGLTRWRDFAPSCVLWLWAVFIFLFFSASHSKLPSYILPIIPAVAVLAARELARRGALPWSAAGVSLAAGSAGIVLGLGASHWFHHVDPATLHAFRPWVVAAGATIILATLLGLARRHRPVLAVVVVALGWVAGTRLIMLGGAAFGPEYSTQALAAEVAPYNRPDVPVYSVGGYQQTLPFYLRRTMTLVAYQGELEFGIQHARDSLAGRYIGTLEGFARDWRKQDRALAFVPREMLPKVKALGIRYRVIARNPRWLALVPVSAS